MIELTKMERAAIRAVKDKAIRDESSKTDAVYLLGVRAGLERAAKIADGSDEAETIRARIREAAL